MGRSNRIEKIMSVLIKDIKDAVSEARPAGKAIRILFEAFDNTVSVFNSSTVHRMFTDGYLASESVSLIRIPVYNKRIEDLDFPLG